MLSRTDSEVKLKAILLMMGAHMEATWSELVNSVVWGTKIIEPGYINWSLLFSTRKESLELEDKLIVWPFGCTTNIFFESEDFNKPPEALI